MNPRELLTHALNQRFDDNTRRPLLFVGSGLHYHLTDHNVQAPVDAPASLAKWNELLREARSKDGVPDFTVEHHDDPTATWESMLASMSERQPTKLASEHETVLLKRVRTIIQRSAPRRDKEPGLVKFGRALRTAKYRDIVTLNFDRTLEESMKVPGGYTGQLVRMSGKGVDRESYRAHLHVSFHDTRIWHAHGMAGTARSTSIQLGLVAYAAAATKVSDLIKRYRARQKAWRTTRHAGAPPELWTVEDAQAWHDHARDPDARERSWVDQAMAADLVFIGCGLDRAEIDMWLLLHERQRQFARIPPAGRPKTFFLHPADHLAPHLRNDPAGLTRVVTNSHDESWELVLGKWWS